MRTCRRHSFVSSVVEMFHVEPSGATDAVDGADTDRGFASRGMSCDPLRSQIGRGSMVAPLHSGCTVGPSNGGRFHCFTARRASRAFSGTSDAWKADSVGRYSFWQRILPMTTAGFRGARAAEGLPVTDIDGARGSRRAAG